MESGTKLGHYEISTLLGKGGMGEVWRARDTKLGREVAIKTLPEEFATDRDRVSRFEREARLLASLNHSNIASIHDFEEEGGTHFLVLELVEGDTLAELLQRGIIPVEESLQLALQVSEALEAAHEKGVIHRDLKPANIKITPEGKVKVLDFGLAKAFAGEGSDLNLSNSPTLSMAATQEGVILGTAAYMSPEQARGEDTDRRTDIWAFGCVLFEMLTGKKTWSGRTVTDVIAAIVARTPEWESLPPRLHSRIRVLLERCLEKEAKDRYQGIGDARVEIQKVLADPGGVSAPLETVAAPSRGRAIAWATGAIVLAIITGLAAWNLRPSQQPGRVMQFAYTLPDGQSFQVEGRPLIAISPDGESFLYNSSQGLVLRSMGELEGRVIAGTAEQLANPIFSPDGQSIAYFAGGELKRIAISGGAPVTLTDAGWPFGASWGADDTIVYEARGGIWQVSANGGTPVLIVEAEEGESLHGPWFLPDGEWLLFTVTRTEGAGRWDGARIVVESVETGERRVIREGGSDARYVSTGHLVYALGDDLLAMPFDPDRLEVTGGAVPIVEGVLRVTNPQDNSGAAQYSISDDGTLVYVVGSGPAAIQNLVLALVDRNGVVETLNVPAAPYRSPRLSRDGGRMAVEMAGADGQSNIWIHELFGTTQMRQLTRGGNNTRPIWTPDGERITFASDRDNAPGIWWQNSDFSGVAARLTTAEEGRTHLPGSWNPDGTVLGLMTRGGPTGNGVSTFTLETEEPEVFYDITLNQDGPAFSPDGQWIAYSSFEPGVNTMEVFVQPFPPTGEVHPITTTGEAQPMLSSDGRELFYRGNAGGPNVRATLSGVEITTEPAVAWGAQQTLPIEEFYVQAGERSFHIMPDGQRFLVAFPEDRTDSGDAPRPQINIVLNWIEELKERVPVP